MSEPTPLLKPLAPAVTAPHIWKGGRFVDDAWRTLGADEPLPSQGRVMIALARWRSERAAIEASRLEVGLVVDAGEVLDLAADALARIAVVALRFARFSDGRAYSTARRLRQQWSYAGEIRAIGDVLIDQIPLMLRSGFDAFQIVDAATVKALRQGRMPAVMRTYQASVSDGATWSLRSALPAASQCAARLAPPQALDQLRARVAVCRQAEADLGLLDGGSAA
jgi:phosphoadenosine phosphosulfate reductase